MSWNFFRRHIQDNLLFDFPDFRVINGKWKEFLDFLLVICVSPLSFLTFLYIRRGTRRHDNNDRTHTSCRKSFRWLSLRSASEVSTEQMGSQGDCSSVHVAGICYFSHGDPISRNVIVLLVDEDSTGMQSSYNKPDLMGDVGSNPFWGVIGYVW